VRPLKVSNCKQSLLGEGRLNEAAFERGLQDKRGWLIDVEVLLAM
jgi:hypothetical protein